MRKKKKHIILDSFLYLQSIYKLTLHIKKIKIAGLRSERPANHAMLASVTFCLSKKL